MSSFQQSYLKIVTEEGAAKPAPEGSSTSPVSIAATNSEAKLYGASPGYVLHTSSPMAINTPPVISPAYSPRTPHGSFILAPDRFQVRVVTGTANPQLARDVCSCLEPPTRLTACNIGRFSDGEIKMQVGETVRGHDLFVIQPCCPPDLHGAIQELVLLSHTLRLASAARVTLVVPYMGYARQDSKQEARTPISALVLAKQMLSTEPSRFLFVDLHSDQAQGLFGNTPVDHLSGIWVFGHHLAPRLPEGVDKRSMVFVAPDAAGVARVRKMADCAGVVNMAAILTRHGQDKTQTQPKRQLVGDVRDRVCLVFDDIIDTGTRCVESAEELMANGAKEVYVAATHGVFSPGSLERINASPIKRVWVTDTICQTENVKICKKLEVISVAPMLASAITAIHKDKAVSTLKVWQSTELAQW